MASTPSRPPAAAAAPASAAGSAQGVQQPKPQALPARSGPSSILVSPRQKGNPVLTHIRSVVWEYSDIPADYIVGQTTCVLFLSLKYHRLHPEYIYSRITALGGKYNLRLLLTMVDIQNHEESLKELSKTSMVNNVTVILAWSAQEAGRYLELFKLYEHAPATSIRAQQATSYSDRLIEFVTVPRSINKTDAVGLVSNFGSIRTAINAQPEEVALIAGWGEKKVKQWCNTVREPFKTTNKATKSDRAIDRLDSARSGAGRQADPRVAARLGIGTSEPTAGEAQQPAISRTGIMADESLLATGTKDDISSWQPLESEEQVIREAERKANMAAKSTASGQPEISTTSSKKRKPPEDEQLSEGMKATLARLRQQG